MITPCSKTSRSARSWCGITLAHRIETIARQEIHDEGVSVQGAGARHVCIALIGSIGGLREQREDAGCG